MGRFVYAYALGSGGDLLIDLDSAALTMADVDDLGSLFGVVEKTLRRVVQQREAPVHEARTAVLISPILPLEELE